MWSTSASSPPCGEGSTAPGCWPCWRRGGYPIVLEIDPPIDPTAQRRLVFYLRAGYWENPYPHVHPPYTPGAPGHPLCVLSYPRGLTPEQYAAFSDYLTRVVMAQ